MKKIPAYSTIALFSLSLIFHLLVLSSIIPYKIVWGGRLKTEEEMYKFETVSVLMNSFFLLIVLMHSGILKKSFPVILNKIFLWLMAALFLLNTLGNLVSQNQTEKIIFTPLTLITSVFCVLMALEKRKR